MELSERSRPPLMPHRIPRGADQKFTKYGRISREIDSHIGEVKHPIFEDLNRTQRDLNIDNTVHSIVTNSPVEVYSVLVDTEDNPEVYDKLYQSTHQTIGEITNKDSSGRLSPDQLILKATHETVRQSMKPLQQNEALKYIEDSHDLPDSEWQRLIPLSSFIEDGVGAADQQALATTAILNRFISIGALEGAVSFESAKRVRLNTSESPSSEVESHSWARYTDGDNVTIIDPANKFVGSLRSSAWKAKVDYFRDEDLENPLYRETIFEVINRHKNQETSGIEGVIRGIGTTVVQKWEQLDRRNEARALKLAGALARYLEGRLPPKESEEQQPTMLNTATDRSSRNRAS